MHKNFTFKLVLFILAQKQALWTHEANGRC